MQFAQHTFENREDNIWPGFVDILSTLLIVIIFILMIFTVSQIYLSDAVIGKDKALAKLESNITKLSSLLSLETSKVKESEITIGTLSGELEVSQTQLQEEQSLTDIQKTKISNLAQLIEGLTTELKLVATALGKFEEDTSQPLDLKNLGEKINMALTQRIEELQILNNKLQTAYGEIDQAAKKILKQEGFLDELKITVKKLLETLSLKESAIEQSTTLIQEQETEIKTLEDEFELQQKSSILEILALDNEVETLRTEIMSLQSILQKAEEEIALKNVEIGEMGKTLNRALVSKVLELEKYKSEFFGQLSEVVSNRDDIEISGDRFIFKSSLLFETASADTTMEGKDKILEIAEVIKEIEKKIPGNVNWIIQIEGHTDSRPIQTNQYASNWELSSARATSVLKLLVSAGIAPEHLAATEYADSHPIALGEDAESYKKNRRIEIRLTQR